MIDNRTLLIAAAACQMARAVDEPPGPEGEPDREGLVNGRLVKASRRTKSNPGPADTNKRQS